MGNVRHGKKAEVAAAESVGIHDARLVPKDVTPKWRASRMPAPFHFPLVVILSVSLSSLSYLLPHEWAKGGLATITRSPYNWGEVAVLAGWRM
jgi:hypothetical protein